MRAFLLTVCIVVSALGAPSFARSSNQLEEQIRELEERLAPKIEPILVEGRDLGVWTSGSLFVDVLRRYGELPPQSRHYTFDSTHRTGRLEESGGGGLGCGWFAEIQDHRDFHARLDVTRAAGSWRPDGHLDMELGFAFAFDAQVHWHVKGPAGPCSIIEPIPTCRCPIGSGVGGSVGVRGERSDALHCSVRVTQNAPGLMSYDISLISPSEIPITLQFDVQHVGTVGHPTKFQLPTGTLLAGSVAAAFGTEGEVTIPTPDPITRRYRFDLREPALVPGSDGIEFLAGAETVWVDGPPR